MQRQALETIKTSVEDSEHPVFPCALIAGDVVILHLLSKLDYLKTGKVTVAFIDTFHLFPETITFMQQLEVHFTAQHCFALCMYTLSDLKHH